MGSSNGRLKTSNSDSQLISHMFGAIYVRITTLSSTISNNPKPIDDSSANNSYMKRTHFAVDKNFQHLYAEPEMLYF